MSADEKTTRQPSSTEGAPEEWLEEHPASAFARWFPYMEAAQEKVIALIIEAAGIEPGMTVLDVGSGAGVPALRLAEVVGTVGRVVATDPSAVSIAAVTENARKRGLTNLEAVQGSAAGLSFAPGSFDAVTCNFGVMFFTDVQAGLTTIRELLRPGRRAAFAAWGPAPENILLGTFGRVTSAYLPEPPSPPEPDAPQPMRFAEPGSLSAALSAAGFGDVQEDSPVVDFIWPGPPRKVLESMLDVSRIEERVPPDRHEAMRAEVLTAYQQYEDGDVTRLSARVVIASGTETRG